MRDVIHGNGAMIELLQADSLEVMLETDPGSVDVIVTSPPYNLGIEYASYDDAAARAEYLTWTDRWLSLAKHVLAQDGSFYLNMGGKPSDPWPPYEVLALARKHFVLQNEIFWVKAIALPTENPERLGQTFVRGHSKPINSERWLTRTVEFVFHFTKTGSVELDKLAPGIACEFADESNIKRGTRGKNGNRRNPGNAWWIPYATIQSRYDRGGHPAPYPPELAERCMRLHGVTRAQKTLDPFSGIGNTALASLRLGIPHLGVEIDTGYHKTAVATVQAEATRLNYERIELAKAIEGHS